MSVVAWDGKILAADKQATCAGLRFTATKIRQLPCGIVLAWTGDQDAGEVVAHWFESGADPAKWPASQGKDQWSRLVVATSRQNIVVYEREPYPVKIEDGLMAWGSGRDYAIGAMARGATACEAVDIAMRFDTGCGMGVDFYELPNDIEHSQESNAAPSASPEEKK